MSTSTSPPHPPAAAPTNLLISQNLLGVVLRARAVAQIAAEDYPYCWGNVVPRDSRQPLGGTTEALSWLPPDARVAFANDGGKVWFFVIARLDHGVVEVELALDSVAVRVAAGSSELARQYGEDIASKVPAPPPPSPNTVRLEVWSKNDEISKTGTSLTVPTWKDIKRNYPSLTQRDLASLMEHHPANLTDGGRLVLFHGPPGVGKTYAIRALMSEWREWCDADLVADPEAALSDYQYLHRLLEPPDEDRWRLVICEDADRFVRGHNRSADNAVLDRLLNATDGLLAQGSRTLFLLTTNIELATVNPALSRPGRCLAVVTFEPFGATEARKWLGKSGRVTSPQMTLAELYAAKTSPHRPNGKLSGYGQYL